MCQQVDALGRQREHAEQVHAQQLHDQQLAHAQPLDNRLTLVIKAHAQAKKKISNVIMQVSAYLRLHYGADI